MAKGSSGQTPILRSVANALKLLETFDNNNFKLSVTELSRKLGLAKSTVSRLLTTLSARGYITQNPETQKYSLGMKVFEVGSVVVSQLTPRETALPFLEHLMERTQETVHLGVMDGDEVVYIEKIESAQALAMYSKIGRRAPLYATSLGKALLAFEPMERIEAFSSGEFKSFTPNTIVERKTLLADLSAVRERGYALDDEEFTVGLKCIAAPVRNYMGKVVASVGVGGPTLRLNEQTIPAMIAAVQEITGEISARLGYLERNKPMNF